MTRKKRNATITHQAIRFRDCVPECVRFLNRGFWPLQKPSKENCTSVPELNAAHTAGAQATRK